MESTNHEHSPNVDLPTPFEFQFLDLSAWCKATKPLESSDSVFLQGRCNYLSHRRSSWEKLEKTDGEKRRNEFRDDIIQEVRAVFARWLRMQNVVVLCGAGTSLCADGCTGNGLLESVESMLIGRNSEPLLQRLLAQHRSRSEETDESIDFEEFLSYVCAVRRCLTPSSSSFPSGFSVALPEEDTPLDIKEIDDLLADLEAAVISACSLNLPHDSLSSRNPHRTMIGKLLSRDPSMTRTKLVTTNYDTLFEQAMDSLGVLYADGFTGTTRRHFNPASFALDFYYPGTVSEGRVRRYDKFMHLYKIHGSINWRKTRGAPEDIHAVSWCGRATPTSAEVLDTETDVDLEDVFSGSCAIAEQNPEDLGLAILPTSLKYGETLAMPYAHLFRAFAEALHEPNTVLFVLGYSGWDRHVNRLIEDALANPSFTLVFINPSVSKWAQVLLSSDRCERIYALAGEWGKFGRFANDILPDVEQLQTQIEVARQLRVLRAAEPDDGRERGS